MGVGNRARGTGRVCLGRVGGSRLAREVAAIVAAVCVGIIGDVVEILRLEGRLRGAEKRAIHGGEVGVVAGRHVHVAVVVHVEHAVLEPRHFTVLRGLVCCGTGM